MSVKYAILGLLHYEDMHGYRIKKHIEHNFGHMWTINYGQIFTALRKMEEEGLVVMQDLVPSDNGGPPRKVYSVTPAGRKKFSRWLASAPEKEMLIRDPFLLRFVFFGFGEPRRALEILEGQIESYEKQLRRRRDNLERWRHHGDYVRLMAELGVQFNESYLEWLRRAHRELSAGLRGSNKGRTRSGGEAREEVGRKAKERGRPEGREGGKNPGMERRKGAGKENGKNHGSEGRKDAGKVKRRHPGGKAASIPGCKAGSIPGRKKAASA